MSKLIVYRASAGSGKTYTITEEYLRLLFANPANFQHTLAVTFTNKACSEMKHRILSRLNDLAKGIASPYMDGLCKTYNCTPEQIKISANIIQKRLLHNYSGFSIETIDSFFQRIVQAFARELGLPANAQIELDTSTMLINASRQLLVDIESSPSLRSFLIDFINDRIDQGQNRKIDKELLRAGTHIFKEQYSRFSEVLIEKCSDKQFVSQYHTSIKSYEKLFRKLLSDKGKKALDLLQKNQLVADDFKGKSRSFAQCFKKFAEGKDVELTKTMYNACNNIEQWQSSDKSKQAAIQNFYDTGGNALLCEILETHSEHLPIVIAASAIRTFDLALMTDIASQLKQYCTTQNVFPLYFNTVLLNKLVVDNHAPFIYEKAGSFLKHFMIDEFQDTSLMQWENFKPLLENSLSEGGRCMLVGDVKQSIYRWRSSDWSLLASTVTEEFAGNVDTQHLDKNWRSREVVIDFNNMFFDSAPRILQDLMNEELVAVPDEKFKQKYETIISNAYQDAAQKKPDQILGSAGMVKIEYPSDEKIKLTDEVECWLPAQIVALQNQGYKAGDIAILVRRRVECTQVMNLLLRAKQSGEYGSNINFDVISAESLLLSNAPSVKIVVHLLRLLANPNDVIARAVVNHEYRLYWPEEGEHEFASTKLIEQIRDKALQQLSLYDVTEYIIGSLKLNTRAGECAFLQTFQSIVNSFVARQNGSIAAFLEWWEEESVKQTVSMPEVPDAMQLMTIHKSKGLQFKVVLMPFCNWAIKPRPGTLLWCNTQKTPFSDIELVPVGYKKDLGESVFYREYFQENTETLVDNLNVLYVAFTRAEEALLCLTTKPGKSVTDIADVIHQVMDRSGAEIFQTANNCEAYMFGGFKNIVSTTKEQKNQILEQYDWFDFSKHIVFAVHSRTFFEDFSQVGKRQQYGSLMHHIFELITNSKDVKPAVARAVAEGMLPISDAERVINTINKWLSHPQVSEWFLPHSKILNETAILQPNDKSFRRPDRVIIENNTASIIDYKFTRSTKAEHKAQVLEYMTIISKMGYTVKGFLWYAALGVIEEIQSL